MRLLGTVEGVGGCKMLQAAFDLKCLIATRERRGGGEGSGCSCSLCIMHEAIVMMPVDSLDGEQGCRCLSSHGGTMLK